MNKIPYMRWSQAWMMLALSQLLCVEDGGNAVPEEEHIRDAMKRDFSVL